MEQQILDYWKIVAQLDPTEVKTFLSLLAPRKLPDPRMVVEAVIEGLGMDNAVVKEMTGENYMMIRTSRSCLINAYQMFNKKRADECLHSMRSHTRVIYKDYPKLLIEMFNKGFSPGFDRKYLNQKADLILTVGLIKTAAGFKVRKFAKYLQRFYESVMRPDIDSIEFIRRQNWIAEAIAAEEKRAPFRCTRFEKIGINCRTRSSIK